MATMNEVNNEMVEKFAVTVETVDRARKEQRVDSDTLELRPGDAWQRCELGGLRISVVRDDRAGRWGIFIYNPGTVAVSAEQERTQVAENGVVPDKLLAEVRHGVFSRARIKVDGRWLELRLADDEPVPELLDCAIVVDRKVDEVEFEGA